MLRAMNAIKTARVVGARGFHRSAAVSADIIGIDLGTTNSCVAMMEVRMDFRARHRCHICSL